MIHLKRTDFEDPEFVQLVSLLDKELWERYMDKQGIFSPHNTLDHQVRVVVAMHENTPVACGAFRPTATDSVAEIKRMFVHTDFRGKGISKRILQELEKWAAEENFAIAILETGIKQPEAIGLYTKSGYERIASYGPYQDIAESVCMRKSLI